MLPKRKGARKGQVFAPCSGPGSSACVLAWVQHLRRAVGGVFIINPT